MTALSGELIGKVHHLPVRVYYEDTDFSGIVYHANYLRFAERGRTDFLRVMGNSHRELANAEEPLFWTIRKITIDYLRPARIDDLLDVRTVCTRCMAGKFEMQQGIFLGDELLVGLDIIAACINAEGRPRRIPLEAMEALRAIESDDPKSELANS